MSKVLITAGNISEPTFYGVCYAVKKFFGDIQAVHIFDSPESQKQAENGSQRSSKVREFLGLVDITTSIITDETLQTVIPNKLSRLMREYGIDELIVDLTNGPKITVSVLYAVSTISRIPNIYALEFYIRPTKETRISDLAHPQEWNYVKIQPLKETLNITQSSYVELVYYRDLIENVTSKLAEKHRIFAEDVKERLNTSLIDYFALTTSEVGRTERLEHCINGLGKICETIAKLWHTYCVEKGLIEKPKASQSFNSRTKQIVSKWDEFRKQSSNGELDLSSNSILKAVIPTLGVDTQLDMMRVYRNLASHAGNPYEFTKEDGRLALDSTLLILNRIAESEIIEPGEKDASITS